MQIFFLTYRVYILSIKGERRGEIKSKQGNPQHHDSCKTRSASLQKVHKLIISFTDTVYMNNAILKQLKSDERDQ